jgi:hypothetical protein
VVVDERSIFRPCSFCHATCNYVRSRRWIGVRVRISLRCSFDFRTLFQRGSLVLRDIHPYGPFVVVNVFSVASLVEHFLFLTLKDLVEIGRSHYMMFTKSVRKDDVRSALLMHTCNHAFHKELIEGSPSMLQSLLRELCCIQKPVKQNNEKGVHDLWTTIQMVNHLS